MTDKHDDQYEPLPGEFGDDIDLDEAEGSYTEQDDFADEGDFVEGDFAEEGGEWTDEPVEDEPARKQKKKGGLSFNTIVILGAVVVGLGFFVMQLAKGPQKTGSQPARQETVARLPMTGAMGNPVYKMAEPPASEKTAVLPPVDPNAKRPQGFLTDPSALAVPKAPLPPTENIPSAEAPSGGPGAGLPPAAPRGPETGNADIPMPAPIMPPPATEQAKAPPPAAAPSPEKPDVLTPMPAMPKEPLAAAPPAMPAPAVERKEMTAEAPLPVPAAGKPEAEKPAGESPAPSPAPSPMPSMASVDHMPALSSDVSEELLEKLDDLSERLTALEGRIDDLASAPETAPEGLESLRETVEGLQRKMDGMSSAAASPARRSEPETAPAASPRPVPAKPPVKAAPAVPSERIHAEQRKPAASPPQWELRSAQPGTAWVAPGGKGEIQTVEVGDTLPGLGRITSVSFVDGHWVVEGTQGRLSR